MSSVFSAESEGFAASPAGSSVRILTMSKGPKGPVAELLQRLRRERGMTQVQLAIAASRFHPMSRAWVTHVENGLITRPEREKLEAIARVLRVPPETLLAVAGYRLEPLPIRDREPEEIVQELTVVLRQRPILVPETRSPASAGPGAPGDVELWPYHPRREEQGHQFIAVRVTGDCMVPRIMPGHVVIVDKDASPRPGDIVLAVHDGETIIKQLEQRNGDFYLTAMQGPAPLRVDEHTRILGVVRKVSYEP